MHNPARTPPYLRRDRWRRLARTGGVYQRQATILCGCRDFRHLLGSRSAKQRTSMSSGS